MLESRGRLKTVLRNIREVGVMGAIRQTLGREEPIMEVTETPMVQTQPETESMGLSKKKIRGL